MVAVAPAVEWNSLGHLEKIADGGFGEVFKAVWEGNTVAVKRLHANSPAQHVAAFVEEATLNRQLTHANIVRYLGQGKSEDGAGFVVQEFMSGGTLVDEINRWNNRHLRMPLALVLRYSRDIARALCYLHERSPRIIHRDLNPNNLLLDGDGVCKVTDFGLAYRWEEGTPEPTVAEGSYRFRAPEMLLGHAYTTQADVYSFALVVWMLMEQSKVFKDKTSEEAMECVMCDDARPPITRLWDEDVLQLVTACWARDPSARPTFREIANRLQVMLERASIEEPFATLRVHAVSCTDLLVGDHVTESSDPYIKFHFRGQKFKTSILNRDLNPKWNDLDWALELTEDNVRFEHVTVQIWDNNKGMSNDYLGEAQLTFQDLFLSNRRQTTYNIERPASDVLAMAANQHRTHYYGTITISHVCMCRGGNSYPALLRSRAAHAFSSATQPEAPIAASSNNEPRARPVSMSVVEQQSTHKDSFLVDAPTITHSDSLPKAEKRKSRGISLRRGSFTQPMSLPDPSHPKCPFASLLITSISCEGLLIGDHLAQSSDPYVKFHFLGKKYKTPIESKNLCPVWEDLGWLLSLTEQWVTGGLLTLQVWDNNRGMSNDYLGEVQVYFRDLFLNTSRTVTCAVQQPAHDVRDMKCNAHRTEFGKMTISYECGARGPLSATDAVASFLGFSIPYASPDQSVEASTSVAPSADGEASAMAIGSTLPTSPQEEEDQWWDDNICQAQALYDYTAADVDQLSLKVGDIVQVLVGDTDGTGWTFGACQAARGYVPSSYIRLLDS